MPWLSSRSALRCRLWPAVSTTHSTTPKLLRANGRAMGARDGSNGRQIPANSNQCRGGTSSNKYTLLVTSFKAFGMLAAVHVLTGPGADSPLLGQPLQLPLVGTQAKHYSPNSHSETIPRRHCHVYASTLAASKGIFNALASFDPVDRRESQAVN